MKNSIFSPKTYRWMPGFLKSIKTRTQNASLSSVLFQEFERAKIHVTVEPGLTFDESQSPLLLVSGGHRPFETFLVLSVLGSLKRSDVKFIAKPYILPARLMDSLDLQERKYTLPVVPIHMARDRKLSLNRDFFQNISHINRFPDSNEIRSANLHTLDKAAQFLMSGGIVNIFPTGKYNTVINAHWFSGVGVLLASIPIEKRKEVLIVNYRFKPYSIFSVWWALWLHHHGKQTNSLEISLCLESSGSIADVLGELTDPKRITDVLRQNYLQFVTKE